MQDHSCVDEFDPNALSVDQARDRILQLVPTIEGYQCLDVRAALDKVIESDIQAAMDVPPFPNSAMDGYALRSEDLQGDSAVYLRIVGTSLAGRPYHGKLQAGQTVRIMTGAVLPSGSDLVVMQEQVMNEAEGIRVATHHRAGENVRYPGDDIKQGTTVLAAGKRLTAADIGLLASLGIREVRVRRSPLVAFFSTGDELVGLGNHLTEGQIFDSNRYLLHGMLSKAGVDLLDLGVVADQRHALERAFDDAAENANMIISTGGVSVGEADYVKDVLQQRGEINFWKIAMKPGRPLTFGRIRDSIFFGLPGNPVSVMACFYVMVLPALRRMQGQETEPHLKIHVKTRTNLRKQRGRTEYQRGILCRDAQGDWVVDSTGSQGSHVLSSMSRANCFIILPADSNGTEVGETVEVEPFFRFM
jgi:molybdopterin molybdotransferase